MKVLGMQINSSEVILVVLQKQPDGAIVQTDECTKFQLADHNNSTQVKQFRNQINAALDTIKPALVGILARNAKAKARMAPSPVSFKLEGIIQLYEKKEIQFVWPQTIAAFLKKNSLPIQSAHKYQHEALCVAMILLNN